MIWAPVQAGFATLHEVRTHWHIEDLLDAQEVLQCKADLEKAMTRNAQKR